MQSAGDANRITRAYFDALLVEMRHIGAVVPDTTLRLFGQSFATPVMMAALSHLNGCHPEGMVEMARGALAAGCVMWAGMGDEAELEAICATGAKTVKIIKPYADEALIQRKIAHAKACGVLAVGMDLDHGMNRLGACDEVLGQRMSPKDLEQIKGYVRAAAPLPFVVKGVLSVTDAKLCLQAGVQGIVVSHHHGILDYAVPPLMALPDIAKAVGGRMPIFVDCGVESGMDVFKALALGATAVSIGRAVMGPLSERGAQGVADLVARCTGELAGAMARTASPAIGWIDPEVLHLRQF